MGLARELFFDQEEVVTDEIENLFSRQKRDGVSPKLVLFPETGGREARRLGELKEAPKIPCCGRGDFFWRTVSHSRKRTRYFRNVGRLVSFAAPALRPQLRIVPLNQTVLYPH